MTGRKKSKQRETNRFRWRLLRLQEEIDLFGAVSVEFAVALQTEIKRLEKTPND